MTLTASEQQIQTQQPTPPITTIINDTLETCLLLRAKIDYKPPSENDGSSNANPAESKLPFNANAVDLCDQEVRVLGYWADAYDLTIHSPCWRSRDGFVWGTRGDDLGVVKELQFKLLAALRSGVVPADMVSGRWGVWSQRRKTFSVFPDIGGRLWPQFVEQALVEQQEGLWA